MSRQKKPRPLKLNGRIVFAIIGMILLGSTVGYSAFKAMIPANREFPVLGMPSNYFIKIINSKDGPTYVLTSSKGSKKGFTSDYKPTITTNRDSLVTLHTINEDKIKHNLNLDEFNVHTNDLNYFGTQSITFVADREGVFHFHCSLHPGMTGTLIVE